MALWVDRGPTIESPALAPGEHELDRGARDGLTIGLINNMPDGALKATERQFMRLLQAAAGERRVRLLCFSLPSVKRSAAAQIHIDRDYADIARLDRLPIDALIVTGAEPIAVRLSDEPFWHELTGIIDWAAINTRSTIFSCLAAHAAVEHLDRIERQRLPAKCSGVFDCVKATDDWLTRGLPAAVRISHSRYNELRESDLVAGGYEVLTRSREAGVDIFSCALKSRFIFFQGHPEYDANSLQREYMRDLARFLNGERDEYPAIPTLYFDEPTETQLRKFERRAKAARHPVLAAELPGLTLRSDVAAGVAARLIFANWLGFLAAETHAPSPVPLRK